MGQNDKGDHDSTGQMVAVKMVEQLILLNANLEKSVKQQESMAALIDELNDWFAVVDKTFEIADQVGGTKKITAQEWAHFWSEAADEIFGEDDGEDEPGPEDPLVGAGRE